MSHYTPLPSFETEERRTTWMVMGAGMIAAILCLLPIYATLENKDWGLIQGFPLGWFAVCLQYMSTFFHELGHAVFMWFYGYVALPFFDFQHGGGATMAITGQLLMLHLLLYAGLSIYSASIKPIRHGKKFL